MDYYPVVGDLVEARVCCYTPTQIGLNVFHWRVDSRTSTGASLAEMAQILDSFVAAPYKALMSSSAKYRGVGCAQIESFRTIEFAFTGNDGAGTLVSDLLPTQCTYVIQRKTLLAGARGQGRVFPPFPPIVAMDPAGTMEAAFAATVDALAAVFNAWLPIQNFVGVTGSTNMKPVLRHSSGATDDIYTFVPKHLFATQRRRGEYGRPNVLPF